MTSQPFLPLFFGDFLAATAEWTGEEQGLYLLILGHQWSLGSLPVDPTKLRHLVRWEKRNFDRAWVTVSTKFEERDGRLYNTRLEMHREKATELATKRAIAGSNGAAKRWQKDKQTDGKPIAIAKDLLCHPSYPNPEESKSGVAASVIDPRKQLFDLGKTILGASAGSLIAQAISRTDESTVGSVLGEMSLKPKADPRAYFVAATTPKKQGFVA